MRPLYFIRTMILSLSMFVLITQALAQPVTPEQIFSEEKSQIPECALPQPLCGDKPNFGEYWNSLSEDTKKQILHGFDIGLSAAWQTSYLEGEEAGGIRASVFDRRLNLAETYAGTGIDFMVRYFDDLYGDAENSYIDWAYAWLLASLTFQEQNQVEEQKKQASYLGKFLRKYGELPGWVRITDVLAIDRLRVEVLVPEPFQIDVKLRGISAVGSDGKPVAQEQTQRAAKFIRALTSARGYPFEDCSCTEMVRAQLFYGSNFFTADGMLEVYIRFNESSFCILKEELPSKEIVDLIGSAGNRGFVLNDALIAIGLAHAEDANAGLPEADRLFQFTENAKEKGYYSYGKNVIPTVEKIIRQGPKPVNQNCLP